MIYKVTDKEQKINEELRSLVQGKAQILLDLLINDDEIRVLQEYSNHVSVNRLSFNDHGPVHMRMVARNALQITKLLREQDFFLSLTQENIGSFDDEDCVLLLAGFLHDTGMSLTRQIHEQTALTLAVPIMNRLLDKVYPDRTMKYVIRSLALEAILGHMGSVAINSYEAGVILVADGCDIERGRATLAIASTQHKFEGLAHIGSVHQHSTYAVDSVKIEKGKQRKIAIIIDMNNPTGYFQVEETLLGKMNKSPIKEHIEVVVRGNGLDSVVYML